MSAWEARAGHLSASQPLGQPHKRALADAARDKAAKKARGAAALNSARSSGGAKGGTGQMLTMRAFLVQAGASAAVARTT